MSASSTVPGAVSVLQTHMAAAVASLPALNASVYVGPPVADKTNNFLMIGDAETGEIVEGYTTDWAALPAVAQWRSEEYGLMCSLQVWSGNVDPAGRLADAFSLMDALQLQLLNDIGGSGALTPSGSWELTNIQNPITGTLGGTGWGVTFTFTVQVSNVRLSGLS